MNLWLWTDEYFRGQSFVNQIQYHNNFFKKIMVLIFFIKKIPLLLFLYKLSKSWIVNNFFLPTSFFHWYILVRFYIFYELLIIYWFFFLSFFLYFNFRASHFLFEHFFLFLFWNLFVLNFTHSFKMPINMYANSLCTPNIIK